MTCEPPPESRDVRWHWVRCGAERPEIAIWERIGDWAWWKCAGRWNAAVDGRTRLPLHRADPDAGYYTRNPQPWRGKIPRIAIGEAEWRSANRKLRASPGLMPDQMNPGAAGTQHRRSGLCPGRACGRRWAGV